MAVDDNSLWFVGDSMKLAKNMFSKVAHAIACKYRNGYSDNPGPRISASLLAVHTDGELRAYLLMNKSNHNSCTPWKTSTRYRHTTLDATASSDKCPATTVQCNAL